jgi:hypothetical protein
VSRLKSAQTDIILMDPQFSPRIIARPTHLLIVDSIDAVAKDMHVGVFRRFALMRYWLSSGRYKMEDIVSADGLHMNDLSYACVANLLADSLIEATESESHPGRRSKPARRPSRSQIVTPRAKNNPHSGFERFVRWAPSRGFHCSE